MKLSLLLTTFMVTASNLMAQTDVQTQEYYDRVSDNFSRYRNLVQTQGAGSDSCKLFLQQWEAQQPDDAEMLYCHSLDEYFQAMQLISLTEDLKKFEESTHYMLPDTISQFANLQQRVVWMLEDEGKGKGFEHFQKSLEYLHKAEQIHPNVIALKVNEVELLLGKYEDKYAALLSLQMIEEIKKDANHWTNYFEEPLSAEIACQSLFSSVMTTIQTLMERTNYSLAEILIDRLIEEYPDNLDFKATKATFYMESYRLDKGIEYMLPVFQENPTHPSVLSVLAYGYMQKGDMENLKKIAELMVQNEDPNCQGQGMYYLSQSEPVELDAQKLKKWVKSNPEEYKALLTRFLENDASLTSQQLVDIYFGFQFCDLYKGKKLSKTNIVKEFIASEGQSKELYSTSKEILKDAPVSISALIIFLTSAQNAGDQTEETQACENRTDLLTSSLSKIFKSQDINQIPFPWTEDKELIEAIMQ